MSFDLHTIEVPDGAYGFNQKGRALIGCGLGVANAAGGSAGASVTVAVSGLKNLPANYGVSVNPGQDATWWISNKTSTGFTINLNPRLAANTLAAGTVDWFLFG
jgi:hypothetical protein